MNKILFVLVISVIISMSSCISEKSDKESSLESTASVTTKAVTTEPEKTTTAATTATAKENVADDDSDISPEFKAAMDSYEEFMDDYVAFMKKYNENPTDLSLLADYATYISKYAEVCEDFAKWESEDLNAAESAYYLEVQARVTKKLIDFAL